MTNQILQPLPSVQQASARRRAFDLAQRYVLLAAMVVLQLIWYAGIWVSGATQNSKVPALFVYTLLAGGVALWVATQEQLGVRWWQSVQRRPRAWLAGLCGALGIAGLVYGYYQRVWPFDEEGAFAAAQLIAQQGVAEFFARYATLAWLGLRHPPLIILLDGFALSLFGEYLSVMRLIALLFTFGTVLCTYQIGAFLYNRQTGVMAALALLSFPLILRLGTTGMLDMPAAFFASLTIYLTLLMERKQNQWLAVAAGAALGCGLLTKYILVLLYPVLFAYCLVRGSLWRSLPRLVILCAVSGALLAIWLGFAFYTGLFAAQAEIIGTYAGVVAHSGATESDWGRRALFETLATRLPSSLGVYVLPFLLLGGIAMVRSWRLWQSQFLALWVALVWAALLATLPDHRYFIITFPALAVIIGYVLARMEEQALPVVILLLLNVGGALVLFVDWTRAAMLFLPN